MALDGRLDAVVLAEAGLLRLGLQGHITERLAAPRFLPAVGQGALGLECRADDAATRRLLGSLDDAHARSAVLAERTVMAELEAAMGASVAAALDGGGSDNVTAVLVRCQ